MEETKPTWEPGEEGLVWRGDDPPKLSDAVVPGDTWEEKDWIKIEHEHYIPVSKFRLLEQLWSHQVVCANKTNFKHIVTRLESIYHFHYQGLLNLLKNDYEYFDPDVGGIRRRGVSEEELEVREHRFLRNFFLTMIRGNFLPFTKEQVKQSQEYDYLFDLDVKIQWQHHDSEMIQGFETYFNGPECEDLRKELSSEEKEIQIETLDDYLQPSANYKNNVFFFWRGIGVDKREEARILQKLDIWISNIFRRFLFPLQRLVELVRGDRKADSNLFKDIGQDVGDLANMLTFGLVEKTRNFRKSKEQSAKTVVFEKKWIRRLNMQNQAIGIRDLFKAKQLQEPEIEKMVCLFRTNPQQTFLEKVWAKLRGETPVAEEKNYDIFLKMFKKIPLADVEMVLPFKKPSMKSFDLTLLMLTGVGSIFALIKGLQSGGKFAIILVGVLLTLFVRLIMGYLRTLRKYNARMISELYEKNVDNDIGVLQFLIDSIEEQEFKEALLAYFMLWSQNKAMTSEELDGAIEEYIEECFDVELDFEVDDALDKVVIRPGHERRNHHLPLVEEIEHNGQLYYRALPLEHVVEITDAKWEELNRKKLENLSSLF